MTTRADAEAPTLKEAYITELSSLMRADGNVWCVDSDAGGYRNTIGLELPDQYLDVGIAEATLISTAAGLAHAGKVPFAHSLAAFITARAYEQIRIDVSYPRLAVRVVGTHGGFSGGRYGPTHYALDDVALMRALPGMTVIVPADVHETRAAVRALAELPGPAYLRLGKAATPPVHREVSEFRIGRALTLRDGCDATLIASGPEPILRCLEARRLLHLSGVAVRVLDMHTIKPIDENAVVRAAVETGVVVAVEEHSVIGGLASAVSEVIARRAPCLFARIGVDDTLSGPIGTHEELLDHHGITSVHVAGEVSKLLRQPSPRHRVEWNHRGESSPTSRGR